MATPTRTQELLNRVFQRWWNGTLRLVSGVVYRWRARNPEDVIQNVAMKTYADALKHPGEFARKVRSGESKPWVIRITMNEIVGDWRASRRMLSLPKMTADELDRYMGPARDADPESQYCIKEISAIYDSLLQESKTRSRRRAGHNDLPDDAHSKDNRETVRRSRARKKLRELLENPAKPSRRPAAGESRAEAAQRL